jgi:hypothetical protein
MVIGASTGDWFQKIVWSSAGDGRTANPEVVYDKDSVVSNTDEWQSDIHQDEHKESNLTLQEQGCIISNNRIVFV